MRDSSPPLNRESADAVVEPAASERNRSGENIHTAVLAGFGFEWSRFTQRELSWVERRRLFDAYFSIFPWDLLPANGGVGADIGCGSGRWSVVLAPKVKWLHLVDASSEALAVARDNLAGIANAEFHLASVQALPFADNSLDFAFSLGVLHHVPDTAAALRAIAAKLRSGAPFLLYLYYAFDNRPLWYRALWKATDACRRPVSCLPNRARYWLSQVMAATVYWPVARGAKALDLFGVLPAHWPLKFYRDSSFYVMRTDALDRFGTRLERRFTRAQIQTMLESSGFVDVRFCKSPPYWCAVGVKA
jgi:SAM-dependent methyltransferase